MSILRSPYPATNEPWRAAWELARSTVESIGYVAPIPTASEVKAAYKQLVARGRVEARPSPASVVSECRAAGLPVL